MRGAVRFAIATVFLLGLAAAGLLAQPQAATIDIRDFAFEPGSLMVPAGARVRWVNRDDVPHSIAMEGGRPGSSRGTLDQGQEHAFVFNEPGRYGYRCGVHPTMLGEITVTGP